MQLSFSYQISNNGAKIRKLFEIFLDFRIFFLILQQITVTQIYIYEQKAETLGVGALRFPRCHGSGH
jgi:hypothetical protein